MEYEKPSEDARFEKLPKWAQDKILSVERRLDQQTEQMKIERQFKHPDATGRVMLAPRGYSDKYPINDQAAVHFQLNEDTGIEVRIDEQGMLRARGTGVSLNLFAMPSAANTLAIGGVWLAESIPGYGVDAERERGKS